MCVATPGSSPDGELSQRRSLSVLQVQQDIDPVGMDRLPHPGCLPRALGGVTPTSPFWVAYFER